MQDESYPFIIEMEATTGNTSEPVAEGWYHMSHSLLLPKGS